MWRNFKSVKGEWIYIFKNWVKYYTKEAFKTLKVILLGLCIILSIACIKYKLGYEVTISGETLGFITDKEKIENKIYNYINDTTNNIAFREIKTMPEYEFKLISRNKDTQDKEVLLAVQNSIITTYRTYAITLDGEQKTIVESGEEAEKIIEQIKIDLNEEVNLNLGITEVYTTDYNVITEDEAVNNLNEVKIAKIAEYEKSKQEEKKSKSIASTTRVASSGSISGIALSMPVSGTLSSRFGSRSASRSSSHTGLDIATKSGTGVRAIASGTVTYAGDKGSYGNLVIVDHGSGIESYYAHCSSIYVSTGEKVDSNTTISAVGSTGNSTGPHLHLEIRVNGEPVNPQNYLY